jgi:hypothetical protein
MGATPEDDKISADLVSDRCQFCGASFNGANQLSLHYKEKHSDKLGEEGNSHKKKLIELGLKHSRTYEIERIFTGDTTS